MQNNRNYIENDQGLEIFTIPNFLTDKECDYLCGLIETNNSRSSVAGGNSSHSTYHNGRTSNTSNLDKSDNYYDKSDNSNNTKYFILFILIVIIIMFLYYDTRKKTL